MSYHLLVCSFCYELIPGPFFPHRAEMAGLLASARSLITKSLKNLPGKGTAMAAEEMTKLMKYLEMSPTA